MFEKSGHDIFREYVKANFPLSDMSLFETLLDSEFHLRFELGDGLKNGTKKRVVYSTTKATTIFEEIFSPEDEVWVLISSKDCRPCNDFLPQTKGYLLKQFAHPEGLSTATCSDITSMEIEEDNGRRKLVNYTTRHTQTVFSQQTRQVRYRNILAGIANHEMGFDPSIGDPVYFVHKANRIAYHMYDDRGCLVLGPDREAIQFLYTKYNDWLVDYHRPYYDAVFKTS